MSDNREAAIVEIEQRVRAAIPSHAFFKRCPTAKPPQGRYPAIFILEGDDKVVSRSSNSWNGYPLRRELDVTVEIWCAEGAGIKEMIKQARNGIFEDKLPAGATAKETKTYGPFNSGMPGVEAMQLTVAVSYTDKGN